MKIKTQAIDKIEDVREGDIARYDRDNYIVSEITAYDDIWTECDSLLEFNECKVVRITVDETASPKFTQAQAQEMYEFIESVVDVDDGELGKEAKQLLKQLESDDA